MYASSAAYRYKFEIKNCYNSRWSTVWLAIQLTLFKFFRYLYIIFLSFTQYFQIKVLPQTTLFNYLFLFSSNVDGLKSGLLSLSSEKHASSSTNLNSTHHLHSVTIQVYLFYFIYCKKMQESLSLRISFSHLTYDRKGRKNSLKPSLDLNFK